MKKTCPACRLVNFENAAECVRCRLSLRGIPLDQAGSFLHSISRSKILRRAAVCAAVCFFSLFGFYLSLILTSKSLTAAEKTSVFEAVNLLNEKGFSEEVFMLSYLTSYRGNDNWLNASTKFESAYAATNYPLEIITIYPVYFADTFDDTERAAILLHEAQHLKGAEEKQAYEFVWRNRQKLGWTEKTHGESLVWKNIKIQTKEFAPELFVCNWKKDGDCTE